MSWEWFRLVQIYERFVNNTTSDCRVSEILTRIGRLCCVRSRSTACSEKSQIAELNSLKTMATIHHSCRRYVVVLICCCMGFRASICNPVQPSSHDQIGKAWTMMITTYRARWFVSEYRPTRTAPRPLITTSIVAVEHDWNTQGADDMTCENMIFLLQ